MKPAIPFTTITIKHYWPDGHDYTGLSFTLSVDVDPGSTAAYFWAQQFWFLNGNGGYIGLQSDGDINGGREKIAIFSIWKSLSAEKSSIANSAAESFDHEGSGFSCKIPFAWEEGRDYKFTIRKLSHGCWEASVTDIVKDSEYSIGIITVPDQWGNLKADVSFFIEYFRSIDSCKDLAYAKATYSRPLMVDNIEVDPVSHIVDTEGPCKQTGVITEMGEKFVMETGTKVALD